MMMITGLLTEFFYKAKYQYLIKKSANNGLKNLKDPKGSLNIQISTIQVQAGENKIFLQLLLHNSIFKYQIC